jgi:hypothetical protein
MSDAYTPKHSFDKRGDEIATRAAADGDPEDLLRPTAAAHYLSKSVSWLNSARLRGFGPPFVRIGSAIRYPRGKLVEYAMDRLHRSTAEYDGGRQNGGRPRTLPRCPHCDQPLPRHLRGAVTDAT